MQEVPGSIPSHGPRHTKDVIKMALTIYKGNIDRTKNVMDKIWDRNPSKSEVIGLCDGDENSE